MKIYSTLFFQKVGVTFENRGFSELFDAIGTYMYHLKIYEKWETCFAAHQNLFVSDCCFSENLRTETPFCSKFMNFHHKTINFSS